MTVYIDVILLVNFLFNAEILLLLYRLQYEKIRPLRLITSALLGGGLSLVVFIPYLQPNLSAAARYLTPFFMSWLCFMPCKLRRVLICGVYIFIMSFIFSGLATFFGARGILCFGLMLPSVWAVELIKQKSRKKYKSVRLCYGEKTASFKGFCDSGNLLTCNGLPVILADSTVFEELFGRGFNILAVNEWIDAKDYRSIPYSSLGKSGAIPGILLDSARVDGREYGRAILGYTEKEFSEKVILSSIMV